MMKRMHVLMSAVSASLAAAGGGGSSSGLTTQGAEASTTKEKPSEFVPLLGTDKFEEHYKEAKTGVPMAEAVDFAQFLSAVANGQHFGQKYAKKFCNGGPNAKSENVWVERMDLHYEAGHRNGTIELGGKGMKVCDAIFGQGKGPIVAAGMAGKKKYHPRGEGVHAGIVEIPDHMTIKSGVDQFDNSGE